MPRIPSYPPLGPYNLDRDSIVPLYRQLYGSIRESILSGQLAAGTRLPPSRALAYELEVSRNTVTVAFDMLVAEGYIESSVGKGSFVTRTLPDDLLQFRSGDRKQFPIKAGTRSVSRRGEELSKISIRRGVSYPCAFRPGVPALDAFPFKLWERLLARRWRKPSIDLMCYGHVGGYLPLREAISAYLGATRGVRCDPEQVIIVTGAQQGMVLAAHLLIDPGDGVWVEDPGYPNARRAMQSAGARVIPVPVDEQGMDLAAGMALGEPNTRMAVITPSYQYPLGISMSLGRRLELLEWAGRTDSWILEDDYDSEYRYSGRPLAALQGLDQSARVIYVGTLSKVLFPSLRIGYLIPPPDLVDPFLTALTAMNRNLPNIDQAVLADFIAEGHYARHVRKMRLLYAQRQSVLVKSMKKYLDGRVEISPAEAGLHLIGWLAAGKDRRVSQELAAAGIYAAPLSAYASRPLPRQGLILGYAGVDEEQIERGVEIMARTLGA